MNLLAHFVHPELQSFLRPEESKRTMNPNICRNCNADVTEALVAGKNLCPACGWWLRMTRPATEPVKPRWPRKRFLFVVFLCFFLGTPVNMALASTYLGFHENIMFMMAGIGSYGAGFTLAKMIAKKRWVFWVLGIVFSWCVQAFYSVAFVALIYYALWHGGC